MVFNKVYIPIQPLENHEDFEAWYEDGALFLSTKCDYESEKSRMQILAKTGAELCKIKPDNKALVYFVGVERYTYELHTVLINQHYWFKGMLWRMHGSISSGHGNFINENTGKKDVLITTKENFKGHGPCLEVKVKDISKLRVAACAVISIMWKEHWKGLSEGEENPDAKFFQKIRKNFLETGLTYEQVQAGQIYVD